MLIFLIFGLINTIEQLSTSNALIVLCLLQSMIILNLVTKTKTLSE